MNENRMNNDTPHPDSTQPDNAAVSDSTTSTNFAGGIESSVMSHRAVNQLVRVLWRAFWYHRYAYRTAERRRFAERARRHAAQRFQRPLSRCGA
jgi:hypothetical protein